MVRPLGPPMYKFMIGNDFHFPAQDDRAVDLWFQVMRYWRPDEIDLLGDISDGTEYSRHVAGGTTEFFNKHDIPKEDKVYNLDAVLDQIMENERPAREFIAENRRVRKKASIHVWDGNHEWPRIYDYFDKYYPEALHYISPHAVYGLDKVKAEYHWYSDEPVQRHGDLYLHHGNMVGTNAGDSVKKHIDTFGVSMVIGHCHRIAHINKTFNLRGEVLRGYENGHMCDKNSPLMGYTNSKNWQQGFMIGLVDDDGRAHVNQIQITDDYTCMVNGRIFSA